MAVFQNQLEQIISAEELLFEPTPQTRVAIDRFHADTGPPEKLADDVYTEWLKNS
jgi:hypothetical protein